MSVDTNQPRAQCADAFSGTAPCQASKTALRSHCARRPVRISSRACTRVLLIRFDNAAPGSEFRKNSKRASPVKNRRGNSRASSASAQIRTRQSQIRTIPKNSLHLRKYKYLRKYKLWLNLIYTVWLNWDWFPICQSANSF